MSDAARFDVVFTDVVMPGMTGIELAKEIRRHHFDLPVVLTSGYSQVLAQNGSYGFELLQKPYSIEQLSRVLHKVGRWRSAKRARTRMRLSSLGIARMSRAEHSRNRREPSEFCRSRSMAKADAKPRNPTARARQSDAKSDSRKNQNSSRLPPRAATTSSRRRRNCWSPIRS